MNMATQSEVRLEAHDLTIRKGDYIVLKNASFSLESGTFAALVGPSGSGKTSLLRVLALLDKPESGCIRIGHAEWSYPQTEPANGGANIYPELTLLLQSLALWPHMTNLANLEFAQQGLRGVTSNILELSELLEISHVLNRYPGEISQGQRQRLALARSLVLKPRYLLLDEPTAALDKEMALKVWKLLDQNASAGSVVLACTHDATLAALCSKTFTIRKDTLVT